jgi:hypothetical protein
VVVIVKIYNEKIKNMNTKRLIAGIVMLVFVFSGCSEFPMDEDDLLITTQSRCYIGTFYLYGPDHIDCLIQDSTVIDTVNLTVDGLARFGTNLSKVKPAASLSLDTKITPEMGVWTDFTEPRTYTLISGDRQIEKEYTITIRVEGQE